MFLKLKYTENYRFCSILTSCCSTFSSYCDWYDKKGCNCPILNPRTIGGRADQIVSPAGNIAFSKCFWVFCNDCITCLITTRDQLPMFVKMTKLLNTNLLSIYISSRITFLLKGPCVICLSFFCVHAFGISYSCFQ